MARGKKYEHNGITFRSGLEYHIALDLEERGVDYGYEQESYEYFTKVTKGVCEDCGGTQVYQRHWYTPDFFLPSGVIVEAKGHFTGANRNLLKAVRDAHDPIDLRLVFFSDNRISKKSMTRYSDWCEDFGFEYAFKRIPDEWL